jgi:hypothetical protein
MLTVEEVRADVEKIRQEVGNDEGAHVLQDRLYVKVLEAIASGNPDAAALAKEALVVEEIHFSRWYA